MILLPPSETKRSGGTGPAVEIARLRFPALAPMRHRALDALSTLSADEEEAVRVLKLSKRQRRFVEVDAAVCTSPTMPAVDRYTGVLYDALGAGELAAPARDWLSEQVVIQSALFGPIGALDPIPQYRMSASTRLPALGTLHTLWAGAAGAELAGSGAHMFLDLRSEAYAALAPLPTGDADCAYLRVVTVGPEGTTRALNHFNKRAKGAFVRALAQTRPVLNATEDVIGWAATEGFTVTPGADGELNLVVAEA